MCTNIFLNHPKKKKRNLLEKIFVQSNPITDIFSFSNRPQLRPLNIFLDNSRKDHKWKSTHQLPANNKIERRKIEQSSNVTAI